MKTLIVIPARLESKRLPRKLLLAETGMPLIWHAWKRSRGAIHIGGCMEVFVATDSDEIYQAVVDFNGLGISTAGQHPNGTSRAAEVVSAFPQTDIFCIVQADEPEIPPALIDRVVQSLEQHPEWDCATAAAPLDNDDWHSPNRVKVFWMDDPVAVDFCRDQYSSITPEESTHVRLHIGIYAYRREALLRYAAAGPCEREQHESLEQLRALQIGLKMGVVLTGFQHHGIDTREDYDAFVRRWREKKSPVAS